MIPKSDRVTGFLHTSSGSSTDSWGIGSSLELLEFLACAVAMWPIRSATVSSSTKGAAPQSASWWGGPWAKRREHTLDRLAEPRYKPLHTPPSFLAEHVATQQHVHHRGWWRTGNNATHNRRSSRPAPPGEGRQDLQRDRHAEFTLPHLETARALDLRPAT